MIQEKTDEAEIQAGTEGAEPPAPPPVPAATTEEPKDYKGLQKVIARKDAELQQMRQQLQERELTVSQFQTLHQKVENMEMNIATLLDAQAGTLSTETPQVSYVERLKQTRTRPAETVSPASVKAMVQQEKVMDYLEENEQPRSLVENDPAFLKMFNAGQYREAFLRAKSLVQEAKKEPLDIDAEVKRRTEEAVQKSMKEHGLKGVDTGGSTGGSKRWTREALREMARTPEGLAEFRKHEKEIMAAERRGEIK